jgi:hypothetical protein
MLDIEVQLLTPHPRFARVSALRASSDFLVVPIDFQTKSSNHQHNGQRVRKRLSDTLRPLQAKRSRNRAYDGFGIHRTRGTTRVVGTGSAVSPVILCLSARGDRQDRSDDRATLDGIKRSRLSSGLV